MTTLPDGSQRICDGFETVKWEPDAETWYYLRAASMAEHGILPAAGGWADQTQKVIDAISLVQCVSAEMTSDRLKRRG